MLLLALKMLLGDRAKFIGILLGLTFSSLIINQQSGIFIGLMMRTFGFISDTSQPNLWVADPNMDYMDDAKPMKNSELYRVRGITGVEWAVPLYKGLLKARQTNGNYQVCNVIGIDDSTLIGGPPIMLEGDIRDLRIPDAVIVNDVGANGFLAQPSPTDPNRLIPLRVGDVLEINAKRAIVVGICQVRRTFQSQPVIYTTYNRAVSQYAPFELKLLTYVLVKTAAGFSPEDVAHRIRNNTRLTAYTPGGFNRKTVLYYFKNTGIIINFGFTVLLGFVIGAAIAGQTFYNFALDNLRYFGTYKAMGASNVLLMKMMLFQALIVGCLGWAIGVGLTAIFALAAQKTEFSFYYPLSLLLGSLFAILLITFAAAFFSLRRILTLEPAIVFKS